MNTRLRRPTYILIAVLFAMALVYPGTPGIPSFSYYPAEPLQRGSGGGGFSPGYAGSVGGVSFSRTAEPGIPVNSIALAYDGAQPDGYRLCVKLNGESLKAKIYDWQLAPIARFADSKYDACFTLFGSLKDKNIEQKILAAKGRVLNYHPAFFNTLVGLRLFQLDLLIEAESIPGVLKDPDGTYLLGAGESSPDLSAEEEAAASLSQRIVAIENSLNMRFRSYIVCDYGQKIEFNPDQNNLSISGNPYYFCWRSQSDRPDFDAQSRLDAKKSEIQKQLDAARSEGPDAFNERNWLVQQLLPEIKEYSANYAFYRSGTVVDLAQMKEEDRAPYLRRYALTSLFEMLLRLRAGFEAYQVDYLKEYSDRLSSEQVLLRKMNPAVWDEGAVVMRYAAFFRYCKSKDPAGWQTFLNSIAKIVLKPDVRTPTGMTPANDPVAPPRSSTQKPKSSIRKTSYE